MGKGDKDFEELSYLSSMIFYFLSFSSASSSLTSEKASWVSEFVLAGVGEAGFLLGLLVLNILGETVRVELGQSWT